MKPSWRKLGLVWGPKGDRAWARTHASCPTPYLRRDGTLRIYVQCRDATNVGRVGWVDLDPDDPTRVIAEAREPVLDVGEPGAFDDNGVWQTSIIALADGRLRMYYVGFELCHHIRYRLLTGAAESHDDGDSFSRVRTTPILERTSTEPHIRGGPFVIREADRYRLWYVAGGDWEAINGKSMPVYDVRYAESRDGLHWPDEGRVVLPVDPAVEHGHGRPWLLRDGDGWRMHYSVRQRAPARYRLGHARSLDGLHWKRDDTPLAGLVPTPGAFDSQALCYAAEIELRGRSWLFYNGDDFGTAGFAVAERLP